MRLRQDRKARRLGVALAGFLATLTLVACQGRSFDESPSTVAAIGEHAVEYGEFERFLERSVGVEALGLENKVMSALFDQFLDEQLLKQIAIERELATTSTEPRAALDALLKSEGLARVSAAEIDQYYSEHRSEYELPERVELRQILVEERSQVETARAELEGGADFAEVAKRISIDPSAPYGGYQGSWLGTTCRWPLPTRFLVSKKGSTATSSRRTMASTSSSSLAACRRRPSRFRSPVTSFGPSCRRLVPMPPSRSSSSRRESDTIS